MIVAMSEAPTLDDARLAKAKLASILATAGNVVGIGITRVGDGFGLKVNLSDRDESVTVPTEVDGVLIVVEVIGSIRKR